VIAVLVVTAFFGWAHAARADDRLLFVNTPNDVIADPAA